MKKVMTQWVVSAAILFGIVGSTSAAVSNAAWLQGTSLDGGSTDLRGTNPKLISWSAHSSIDPTAFKHSLVDATQLTVTKDGDYFVATTLPIQGAAVRSVDTLEVFVNDEAVPGAISRCTYIRNANAQTESSAHIAQLIPGLKANDVITVKTYRGSNANPRTDMGTASLFVELLDDSRNVFGSTSAGTGNANLNRDAGEEDMYLKWDGVGREGSAFSAADSTITLKDQGSYLVTVNVPLQGNVVRASVGLSLLLGDPEDGEWALGGLAQQGYIRHFDGHNKASIHFSGVINTAEANTDLSVYLEQRAAAGDVTLGGKLASIFIEKISADGLFHATATQMVNGENWNPDKKDQVSWEEENRVIDSNAFGHGGDDLQNIVIKKAGSYLLAYNDVLEGGNLRANPRITVEVNGAEVPGAQTKSHYNRRASGHDEVSGSMVVLLENLAADDVVTVSAQREGNGGIVTAAEPALLSLIQKDSFSIPAGDQSPPHFSSFSGGLSGFSAIVEDFGLKLDVATLKATLNGEVVDVTVDSANGVNSINYAFAAFPPTGSEHALNIAFNDTGGNAHSMNFAFTVTTQYLTLSPAYSMSDVNKDKGGFRVNLTQISARQTEGPNELHGNQWVNAEKQIRGEFLNPNEVDDDDNPLPYLNEADPDAWEGWSIAPVDVDYVNMNQDEDGNIGNFGEDQMLPNIPGWGESTDGIAGEFLTVLHLKRGFQTLGVNSDDGFRATIGLNYQGIESQQIGLFNGGRGAADSLFNIVVTEEGYYPLRVLWWEGGGGANIEIFSVVDGAKVLVNDPDNADAIKAYNIGNSTSRTYFGSVSPEQDDPTVVENSISATIIEDGTKAKSGSIKVLLNGEEVDASVQSADGVVTVTAEPDGGLGLGSHTAKIVFTETTSPETERSFEWSFEVTALSEKIRALVDGEPNPIAYWDFDFATDPATAYDHVLGYQGDLVNAKYTEDKGGHTGEAGDRAMDFLVTPAGMLVQDAEFLNIASGINKVTISVWVKNHAILPNATVFFALTSPDNPGTDMEGRTRFVSFHIPWGNENIYFDTAGCCSTVFHRIMKNNSGFSWDEWHHYVFVKDEDHKSIWIDGELFHEGENTLPLPHDNDLLAVGSDIALGRSFSGIVDDLAIFASALTEEQIVGLAAGKTDILPEKRDPAPDLTISVVRNADGTVTVTYTGKLQVAPTVNGPWEDVEGATSPLTLQPDQPATFGRTVSE
jgi:hypothetical protein